MERVEGVMINEKGGRGEKEYPFFKQACNYARVFKLNVSWS